LRPACHSAVRPHAASCESPSRKWTTWYVMSRLPLRGCRPEREPARGPSRPWLPASSRSNAEAIGVRLRYPRGEQDGSRTRRVATGRGWRAALCRAQRGSRGDCGPRPPQSARAASRSPQRYPGEDGSDRQALRQGAEPGCQRLDAGPGSLDAQDDGHGPEQDRGDDPSRDDADGLATGHRSVRSLAGSFPSSARRTHSGRLSGSGFGCWVPRRSRSGVPIPRGRSSSCGASDKVRPVLAVFT